MNKKLIALFALSLPLILTSCGDKKPNINDGNNNQPGQNDNDETEDNSKKELATMVLPEEDHFKVTTTLDDKEKLYEGDTGIMTFKMDTNYQIKSVIQDDWYELPRLKEDKYSFSFELIAGENVFTAEVEFKENIYSPNGLIEGPDNTIEKDGNLTDVVDPLPVPGEIIEDLLPPVEKPTYKNGKTIYLYTQEWWDRQDSYTGIICYDSNKAKINTPRQFGAVMETALVKDNCYKVLSWVVDAETTSYVQFTRTNGDGTKNYNGRTDLLPVPDFETYDAFVIDTKETWYSDSGFTKTTLVKFTESYIPLHTHIIYFRDEDKWNEAMARTFITMFDENKEEIHGSGNVDGTAMTHVKWDGEAKKNVYKFTILSDVKYVCFKRYAKADDPVQKYWGAFTEKLAVPDWTTYNGYAIKGDTKWGDTPTEVELFNYVPEY